MEFRPCIDIHNGRVKQIVGESLQDAGNLAEENFVADQDAAFYAKLYREAGIRGGHVILLNPADSPCYAATREQALGALRAYPGGLQAGGGITPLNAADFLEAGASHVIVTSYVFRDGRIHYDRLERMRNAVGRKRLVLDLSCRRTSQGYMAMNFLSMPWMWRESRKESRRSWQPRWENGRAGLSPMREAYTASRIWNCCMLSEGIVSMSPWGVPWICMGGHLPGGECSSCADSLMQTVSERIFDMQNIQKQVKPFYHTR